MCGLGTFEAKELRSPGAVRHMVIKLCFFCHFLGSGASIRIQSLSFSEWAAILFSLAPIPRETGEEEAQSTQGRNMAEEQKTNMRDLQSESRLELQCLEKNGGRG